MRTAFLALGIVAVVWVPRTRAQGINDLAAYGAMISTPVAAVSPVVLPYMTGIEQQGLGFAVRYGRMSFDGGSTYALLGDFTGPAGKGSWGLGAGYLGATCGGCVGNLMADVHIERPLATAGSKDGTLFTLGMQGTVGFAKPSEGTAWAGAVNVPVALSVTAGRVDIVPFVSPGIGIGMVSEFGSSDTGYRFELGGGVGVANVAPGLEITASAEKVLISGGRTVFGLGLSWTRSR